MPTSLLSLLAAIAILGPQQPAGMASADPAANEQAWATLPEEDVPSMMLGDSDAWPLFALPLDPWATDDAQQVRIEQHLVIRISPRAPEPMFDAPQQQPTFYERKTSRCLPIQGIAGVQALDSRLMLVMRDRRLIGATLDRSCRARDFYSGFYVEHTSDGMLCAGRDDIHSRAGSTCGVTALHELIPND